MFVLNSRVLTFLQELCEHPGIRLLNERPNDPTIQDSFESIFPKDNPKEHQSFHQLLHLHRSRWHHRKPEGVLEEHATPRLATSCSSSSSNKKRLKTTNLEAPTRRVRKTPNLIPQLPLAPMKVTGIEDEAARRRKEIDGLAHMMKPINQLIGRRVYRRVNHRWEAIDILTPIKKIVETRYPGRGR